MAEDHSNNDIPENGADDDMDNDIENENEGEESFAAMFESYSAGMKENLRVGDKIEGRIIAISDSAVFVDTGTKADGVAEIEELKDEEGNLPYAVGDIVTLYVVGADESEIRLSKAIAGAGGLEMLKDAFNGGIPVEGKVTHVIKGGLQVEVLKRRAFCPISQIDTHYVENPETYVGQSFEFVIKRLTENGRNIVVSRRELLEAEQQKAIQAFMETIAPDQVVTGRVTRLMPYGAFVELVPGLEGMVHISELGWSRVENPADAVQPNQQIQVKVLRIEHGPKGPKIALSLKQVDGDPWDRLPSEIQTGRQLNGKVTRCAPFGAFVELAPGIEGLVHISEMSYTQRVHKPEDVVQPGQGVTVVVKEVDTDKRRIGLSLRDAEGDPWSDVERKYAKGQPVKGTVEKQESFGIFVRLEPGIVGLLPKSALSRSAEGPKMEKLKPGDPIAVAVDTVQADQRKISLKPADAQDEDSWREFKPDSGAAPANMGALGEQLARALKKRNDE
ncbi:30S ribosomal protein S1 [Desulfatitalea alkaliphila]|uniref:30S ribosomal protein S1 n=1 Tax=Desulfatitalea alkaliphila TaxID=2929485 RepID=A0AA41UI37_9BACT|nr:30S ribosomal protein S1 [Desulfatitalea alkaliphila]MCJ8499634.1 30S ribosomal protein S1 [Desulfatitalea alkaliphila]